MKMLTVLLVEDSPEYSSLILHWLSGGPNQPEFSLVWTDSLGAAIARLAKGGIDLILADLGLPDSDGLKTFLALRADQENLPIIVLSASDNQGVAIQAIQQGAEDYLVKSTCTPELLIRTLRHSLIRHQSVTNRTRVRETANVSRVVGVVGGAGGCGATTVAGILAAELRCHTDQSTLLIELDPNPGLVSFSMGIEPRYTVQDLAENTERLDISLWDGAITRLPGNLDILTSSTTIGGREPEIDALLKIIAFAADNYRWIVMDLGRLNRTSKQLLGSVHEVVVVSAQSVSALHQCKNTIGLLQDLGIDRDRIRLILNRIYEGYQLPRAELEDLLGVPIAAILPAAHQDLYDASLKKRLPGVASHFRVPLAGVARKLAGLPNEDAKRTGLTLASLVDRFRRKSVVPSPSLA